MSEKVFGVIPARYESSRFPGKPLKEIIEGKSLIRLTYENALQSECFDDLFVATDNQEIYDHVKTFGHVIMTSSECETGTDRIKEAVMEKNLGNDDSIIVNVQGDTPCIEPDVIKQVVDALKDHPEDLMATPVVPTKTEEEALSPSVVKCVMDLEGNALYFSRALIPSGTYSPDGLYYHHLGIYAFRRKFLYRYSELPPTPLMQREKLEQLKVLENGYRIRVVIVESESFGVDTPEDVKKMKERLCKKNISS